jgi:hypothetical protein
MLLILFRQLLSFQGVPVLVVGSLERGSSWYPKVPCELYDENRIILVITGH